MFLTIYLMKAQEYRSRSTENQRNLQHVLQGQVNQWIVDLAPDIEGYLSAIKTAAFAGIAYCRDYAASLARPVWGFKYPGWGAETIRLLHTVMPKARFLLIIRDLIPSLKSAKAQQLVISLSDTNEFCRKWARAVSYYRSQQGVDPSMLPIQYEALIEDPEAVIREIGEFTGIRDMDRSIFQKKINVHTGQSFDTQVQDGYVPPEEISETEMQIVNEVLATMEQPRIGR